MIAPQFGLLAKANPLRITPAIAPTWLNVEGHRNEEPSGRPPTITHSLLCPKFAKSDMLKTLSDLDGENVGCRGVKSGGPESKTNQWT